MIATHRAPAPASSIRLITPNNGGLGEKNTARIKRVATGRKSLDIAAYGVRLTAFLVEEEPKPGVVSVALDVSARDDGDVVLDEQGTRVVLEMLRSPPPPTEELVSLMSQPRRFGELVIRKKPRDKT